MRDKKTRARSNVSLSVSPLGKNKRVNQKNQCNRILGSFLYYRGVFGLISIRCHQTSFDELCGSPDVVVINHAHSTSKD